MTGLLKRAVGLLLGLDEGINALGGGSHLETVSGTLGRAVGAAGGKRHWWGPALVSVVNAGARIITGQTNHCQQAAEAEAARRAAESTIIPAP
ncbi:MAG: hypothetical protein JWQ97_3905 [Phenylobacterium sp.]|nr:hypothetical protein [Phenylobacterium sp.]